ncbi:30S ribosomal protein S4 [candidate division WOR-1 bacterium RIFOXYA12_FULL_43_27]|uniref:Small ribosomal subunit protein uS4 n=1 Tax=candidate division WOR-1 bacterium RIFOXYC2_FULL_46_14 TaxID=1802587 RepID=A0A1F4U5X0_UNCSA|nr:MAG: 30S ribosomal protein S4 [candidate division WOR-1 bacterium RIFOXYA12_FULL_43_27]OGC20424.1 MAG: 30S ribosomal protein S4 [candidate division WOR-1 bacterium RIFOXYB2_FULL_46_45]OGC31839.1 MAG: 30S ribosomal protein S4 [candidate division WOR-1 bacterium RIFOXYA2_FULL_46_56]OGC40269.1 MAG: 30S ribosomal protein S4 [candidate division WOR-1 bacterium RIFOXYC2_FULL_46_14]
MGRVKLKCKLCRREKEKLFLKGDKCNSPKCPVERRKYPPGQHGDKMVRPTEYSKRLREKQKARRIYGLNERQFENYFEKARKIKGDTGQNLLILLERRLDNVVFKLGFSASRAMARQLARHGKVKVNGQKVNVPSYQVSAGDELVLSETILASLKEKLADFTPPSWLIFESENYKGRVAHLPGAEDTEKMIVVPMIVEYYSR